MGPLSKLWLLAQNTHSSQEEEVPEELNKVKEYVEQSILLLGQETNSITYHRRHNILSELNCAPQQPKEMLREEADLLPQQDKNLFSKANLFRQPNQRSKPSNCFGTRVRKNRSPSICFVNHLSFLFDAGLEYRTIGCHRTAISAYHDYIDGKPVGQHPKVCALTKGHHNHDMCSFGMYRL